MTGHAEPTASPRHTRPAGRTQKPQQPRHRTSLAAGLIGTPLNPGPVLIVLVALTALAALALVWLTMATGRRVRPFARG